MATLTLTHAHMDTATWRSAKRHCVRKYCVWLIKLQDKYAVYSYRTLLILFGWKLYSMTEGYLGWLTGSMIPYITQNILLFSSLFSQCVESELDHQINPWWPRQKGHHFPDDIFKCIFLNENALISIKISLKFVPRGPINNIPSLVQIMAWCRPGDKPLSEPMMVNSLMHICITLPQWVNWKQPYGPTVTDVVVTPLLCHSLHISPFIRTSYPQSSHSQPKCTSMLVP